MIQYGKPSGSQTLISDIASGWTLCCRKFDRSVVWRTCEIFRPRCSGGSAPSFWSSTWPAITWSYRTVLLKKSVRWDLPQRYVAIYCLIRAQAPWLQMEYCWYDIPSRKIPLFVSPSRLSLNIQASGYSKSTILGCLGLRTMSRCEIRSFLPTLRPIFVFGQQQPLLPYQSVGK